MSIDCTCLDNQLHRNLCRDLLLLGYRPEQRYTEPTQDELKAQSDWDRQWDALEARGRALGLLGEAPEITRGASRPSWEDGMQAAIDIVKRRHEHYEAYRCDCLDRDPGNGHRPGCKGEWMSTSPATFAVLDEVYVFLAAAKKRGSATATGGLPSTEFQVSYSCTACGWSGPNTTTCPRCDGLGKVPPMVTLSASAWELEAWQAMAKQAGAIDRACAGRITPDDVLHLVTTLRTWLSTAQDDVERLHSELDKLSAAYATTRKRSTRKTRKKPPATRKSRNRAKKRKGA